LATLIWGKTVRTLPAKAKNNIIWGIAGIALGVAAIYLGWDWKPMVLGFGFGAVMFGLGIWTIQSDRRIEDLKRQAKELDIE
jgi:hypothetical protein